MQGPSSAYPEHDKLDKVKAQTEAIGEFLGWAGHRGVELCAYNRDEYWPVGDFQRLLADWAGIDRDRLAAEKEQMLDDLRRANGR